ncbi:hypothetical protein GLYMA_19G191400v4 [Glycine max]|uniref:Uncharacterized protein n=1 Tax=Glycine max TaxID=3847 RepID=A0A0R0EXY0_SOYBN|nr:hypothetical protein JHK87_053984 [Glycine soja]KAH1078580.1 hypothetical protein GYH30_053548 [Glycine max]KRG96130.1 hypothetical protein GLYMA_19G191400v4 [Glycine max]
MLLHVSLTLFSLARIYIALLILFASQFSSFWFWKQRLNERAYGRPSIKWLN